MVLIYLIHSSKLVLISEGGRGYGGGDGGDGGGGGGDGGGGGGNAGGRSNDYRPINASHQLRGKHAKSWEIFGAFPLPAHLQPGTDWPIHIHRILISFMENEVLGY